MLGFQYFEIPFSSIRTHNILLLHKIVIKSYVYVSFLCVFTCKRNNLNLQYNTTQHYILFGNIVLKLDAHNPYIELSIPHFKNSKSLITTIRLNQNKTNSDLCPHQALIQYLNIRKHDPPSQPLFSFMDGTSVTRQQSLPHEQASRA